jgi:microcompartment protein CcmL/EutN
MTPEALAIVEFSSIAAGTRASDALLKKAPVKLERVGSYQPGKFAVLFSGDVASTGESFAEALRIGGVAVADHVMLPQVEPTVYRAIIGEEQSWKADTLGVIETSTLAGAILAADAAVKGATVLVVTMQLGDELGGKGVVHLAGEQHDVEAALEIGATRAEDPARRVWTSLIPRYADELRSALESTTRFWGNG